MIRATLLLVGLLLSLGAVAESDTLYELRMLITVDAKQSWRADTQWSEANTQQRYELTTRLRSDGRLYTDNLLEPDTERRMRIKAEYYTYKGLVRLIDDNGGQLPDLAAATQSMLHDSMGQHRDCMDAADCPSEVAERFAALSALQSNTREDLLAFIRSFDDPEARYRYLLGYAGCPNKLSLQSTAHIEGMQARDRDHKKIKPFSLDWKADSAGSSAEQQRLCFRYVATVDTKTGEVYLENAFIPSAHGIITSVFDGSTESREGDVPVPTEALHWVDARLKKTDGQVKDQTILNVTYPLDGNSTVLGAFQGQAKVSLNWSLLPAH